jgi:GTP pyrophosphokinase
MRIEIQIRSRDMHSRTEFGLAAHWAYKQGGAARRTGGLAARPARNPRPEPDAEELLENTRIAMYQDRIFAFTPKGELHPAAQGRDAGRFRLCDPHRSWRPDRRAPRSMGGVVPLRTVLQNGDQVEILNRATGGRSRSPGWLTFAITAKARAAIRRYIRHKQRDETIALGEKAL